jgi:putative membrane protein
MEENMRNILGLLAASSLAMAAVPALAQTMTPTDVGVSPLAGTSATDYVKLAADSDNFEIQSGRIASTKSKRQDVKSFGRQMIAHHTGTTKSLMAALDNKDRKIVPPSPKLSAANAAKIDLLRKAPKNSFDQIYLQQQLEAHRTAWALHKGYSTDGTDASLKQVATTAVPVVEGHLAMLKSMTPGGM